MGPKKRALCSPAQKSAKSICKKYRSKRMSPDKKTQVRRALYQVCNSEMSLRKAASEYGLSYGFLHRRYSGEVEINKVKGPPSVFTEAEEESMALWLSEMAQRGMGLRVCEFLDFVQDIVKKDKRKTPFKDSRPGRKWYKAFLNRNASIIDTRVETPLELKRSKVTKNVTDKWYNNFRDFLVNKGCIDSPRRIWNADETGFNMGSNKSKVIGPSRRDLAVPHITAGKQRLTVMYCGSASGHIMPPFFVYPEPKPRSYNPLNGAAEGSAIAYTKKGWMDVPTFAKFIEHFNKFAGPERPVILLLDSVSSHVDHSVFMDAKSKGIELYRIVPNATHLMQPLDKGVFGPLKAKWHLTARKYSRENPGQIIGKENFAEKLNDAFLQFYKPLTVINAFKSSGIYPVDSSVITKDILKPSETFNKSKEVDTDSPENKSLHTHNTAKEALGVFEETLTTPVREKYHERIYEGYDVEGISPCYDVYRKLHKKAHSYLDNQSLTLNVTGLNMLAEAALQHRYTDKCKIDDLETVSKGPSCSSDTVSPVLRQALVFPEALETVKPAKKTLLNTLPDNLTSAESIRTMSLRDLEKVKKFAERERKAKVSYTKKELQVKAKEVQHKGKSKANPKKGKRPMKEKKKISILKEHCKACLSTWDEDLASGEDRTWVQCDGCDGWIHADCLTEAVDEDDSFFCPDCQK